MTRLISTKREEKVLEFDGQKIKTTHLDKVFWPDEGYTKGDLIDYYIKMSKYILPFLKNRPESLNRYPDGIFGNKFYQKNMEGLVPNWIKTIDIFSESDNKNTHYMIANDLASLIYMINLGCIDINPWNSRIGNLDNPDYLVIDLDPLEIPFSVVVKTAQVCHQVLDDLQIKSYLKTSGATGLHIYIPMGAKYSYEQVRNFAEVLVNLIHQKVPSFTSVERMPSKRRGKVYLDFLQNSKGQTLAAPYSVRPVPGAQVSTPLLWSELNENLSPSNYNIKNIFNRLEKVGEIFHPVLEESNDIEQVLKKIK